MTISRVFQEAERKQFFSLQLRETWPSRQVLPFRESTERLESGREVYEVFITYAGEWQLRADLAAAYQICQKLGFNEGICNHLTVSLPEDATSFLVVPYGLL